MKLLYKLEKYKRHSRNVARHLQKRRLVKNVRQIKFRQETAGMTGEEKRSGIMNSGIRL